MSKPAEAGPAPVHLPIARALRQAAAHPSVKRVEIVDGADGEVHCEIDIRTEMPAAWRAVGESPFGVRVIETVTLTFPALFPLAAPRFALRADFDRSHPHLNPGKRSDPPVPCLVAGSPREVVQARGFIGLVEQLVVWLDKASSLDLNNEAAGWEAVRRDRIDDVAVVDSVALHALADRKGGAAWLWSPFLYEPRGTGHYRIHSPVEPTSFGPRDTALLKRGPFRDDEESGLTLTIAVWGGERAIADQYRPEDVETLGDLRDRAAVYGCRDYLDAKLSHLANRLSAEPVGFAVPLVILLLARRPYRVVGTGSSIETCGYLVEVPTGPALRQADTPVRLLGHRDTPSVGVLRRASGDHDEALCPPWTLLGCGSVGSKIALHMARAGRSPARIVDKDLLEPHNFARHADLPFHHERHALFMISKVQGLGNLLAKLGQRPVGIALDALSCLLDPAGRATLAPAGAAMIVNTTASAVVREAFAHHDWPDRPRLVEACLLGAGRAGFLGVEGPGANPNASDLMTEAYRHISQDPDLADLVLSAEAEAIQIGQGCGTFSFAMPDAQLSALTAPMAGVIGETLRTGLPAAGSIRIGVLEADMMSQRWAEHVLAPWVVVGAPRADGPVTRIHPRVDAAMREEIARWPRVETGGILVGRYSQIGNCFQVVDHLPAPPDSRRSAAEFLLGTDGVRQAADALFARSRGTLQVLGTWHSHLAPSGPSGTDRRTGAWLAAAQLNPLLMLIATPVGYTSLIVEAVDGQVLGMSAKGGARS